MSPYGPLPSPFPPGYRLPAPPKPCEPGAHVFSWEGTIPPQDLRCQCKAKVWPTTPPTERTP